MKKILFSLLITIFTSHNITAQVLPVKEQSRIIDEILSDRLNNLLPTLMEKNQIDMWVIVSREYNEDPIIKTMLPSTWLNARRRTILVFYHNPSEKVYKKLAIARYNVGDAIEAQWDMNKFPDQWDALNNIIEQYNPEKIALNTSKYFGLADGIDHTDYQELTQKLSSENKKKVISAENLAITWLETRTPREMEFYPQLNNITHRIIAEGFSNKAITPGITTSDDLVWWFRQKVSDMGLSTWFHPSVNIQRNDQIEFDHLKAFSKNTKDQDNIIRAGDLLHVDFGVNYLRLNTDIQEHAYVLKPGEKEAPKFLRDGLTKANRLQDILTSHFKKNKSGNEILADALAQAKDENINATIYTHPLGSHGHAAGPTIGMWDQQKNVPGTGDYPMYYNTAYSIELNAAVYIPEWKKEVRFMLEQNGYFDKSGFWYLDGRQKNFHLIGSDSNP